MKDLNRGITAGLMIVLAGCVVISGAHAKQGSGHGPAPFSDFDMDGNGLVSEAEFYSLREQRMAARASEGKEMRCAQFSPSFADLDKDGDGQLSPDELSAGQQAHMAKCKEMRKGDGKGKGKGMQGNMPQFSDFDLDGDGLVDSGEEVLSRKGGGPTDFRASWRTYSKSANDSFFTPKRGMRH